MEMGRVTHQFFRMFRCEAKAKEFYIDFLGFTIGFEHRFEPGMPLYMGITLDSCFIHLSEHHGDASPGAHIRIECSNVDELQKKLIGKTIQIRSAQCGRHALGDARSWHAHDPFQEIDSHFYESNGRQLRYVLLSSKSNADWNNITSASLWPKRCNEFAGLYQEVLVAPAAISHDENSEGRRCVVHARRKWRSSEDRRHDRDVQRKGNREPRTGNVQAEETTRRRRAHPADEGNEEGAQRAACRLEQGIEWALGKMSDIKRKDFKPRDARMFSWLASRR